MKKFIVDYQFKDAEQCCCESCDIVKVGGYYLTEYEAGNNLLTYNMLVQAALSLAMLKYGLISEFNIISIEET